MPLAALLLTSTLLAAAPSKLNFNRDIRPILSDRCFSCHGPDEKARQAGLRLDTKEGAFARKGLIVAGDAEGSRLLESQPEFVSGIRVRAADDAERTMPKNLGGHAQQQTRVDAPRVGHDNGAELRQFVARDTTRPQQFSPAG